MSTISVIHGVDDTLKKLATDAVANLDPKPGVTVGALSGTGTTLRVNWFLYRIEPHAAYRNMEPPRTGWRTRRGDPPVALRLHYLLTAFPAAATDESGDQEQFSHAALAAVMRALAANAIVGESDTALAARARPLLEPLRIAMESLDLDALSKIWTACDQAMRLSVGYEVSLVAIDAPAQHAPGPPVRTRHVAVSGWLGPRLMAVAPARVHAAQPLAVQLSGATSGVSFTLERASGDPAGSGPWALPVAATDGPGVVRLQLPRADLAPGTRRLEATALLEGLPAGHDAIAITVVPAVTGPAGPVTAGSAIDLATEHAAADVEVFLDGKRLPGAQYADPTKVTVTIPAGTPAGDVELLLRAGKVAGPPFALEVHP